MNNFEPWARKSYHYGYIEGILKTYINVRTVEKSLIQYIQCIHIPYTYIIVDRKIVWNNTFVRVTIVKCQALMSPNSMLIYDVEAVPRNLQFVTGYSWRNCVSHISESRGISEISRTITIHIAIRTIFVNSTILQLPKRVSPIQGMRKRRIIVMTYKCFTILRVHRYFIV